MSIIIYSREASCFPLTPLCTSGTSVLPWRIIATNHGCHPANRVEVLLTCVVLHLPELWERERGRESASQSHSRWHVWVVNTQIWTRALNARCMCRCQSAASSSDPKWMICGINTISICPTVLHVWPCECGAMMSHFSIPKCAYSDLHITDLDFAQDVWFVLDKGGWIVLELCIHYPMQGSQQSLLRVWFSV